MSIADALRDPTLLAAATLFLGAAASGISLYATLVALGVASRLELIPILPAGLTGLENGLVIASAAVLLAVEAVADREPAFAGMWHSLHAVVKPIAAALLTLSALAEVTPRAIATCAAAAGVALLFHAVRYGARIAHRMPAAPRGGLAWTAAEIAIAIVVLLPLRFRDAAVPTAAALALVGLIAAPAGSRAFVLGVTAQRSRLRAFLGEAGWKALRRLPRSLRRLVPDTRTGGTPPRATRCAILAAPGVPRFRIGWLVVDADGGPHLLSRSWLRGTAMRVQAADHTLELVPGAWADLLRVEQITEAGEARKLQLLLLKDGPAASLVVRSLRTEPAASGRVHD